MDRQFSMKLYQDKELRLYGRALLEHKINDYVLHEPSPENVALLGVKGSGKSTLLRTFFNLEKRKEYYNSAKVLATFISIPDTADSMKSFYSYLNMTLLEGLELVEMIDANLYDTLLESIAKKKNQVVAMSAEIDDAAMSSILRKTLDVLANNGIKPLFIFDDFEKFADSSKLKKSQYKFMRDLCNSQKISMLISTNQDLVRVSEEVRGSGFENVFFYEELRGIRERDTEEWISDAEEEYGFEWDDDIHEWIYNVSGGIPELILYAGETSYEMMESELTLDETEYTKKIYQKSWPLLKQWWDKMDEKEHAIMQDLCNGTSKDSRERDTLIKKGYLKDEGGIVSFCTPLLEMFTLEKMIEEPETNTLTESNSLIQLVREMINEGNLELAQKLEQMNSRISSLSETLQSMLEGLPERSEFYLTEEGELDFAKYSDAISSYLTSQLISADASQIKAEWNISDEVWDSFSAIRKNDCSMAYRMSNLVFRENIANLDYTPVMVMLGNFLEGTLNDRLLPVLRHYCPYEQVRVDNIPTNLINVNQPLMLGSFVYLLHKNSVRNALAASPNAVSQGVSINNLTSFKNKLVECHAIRNKGDHPGVITTYSDRNTFVANMFLHQQNMLKMMIRIGNL